MLCVHLIGPIRDIYTCVVSEFIADSLLLLQCPVMDPIGLVKLAPLMGLGNSDAGTVIGMIDGPVAVGHPDLASESISETSGRAHLNCVETSSAACQHGTFVAGILMAKRKSPAPAICPDCTLLVQPIFKEATQQSARELASTPEELAAAIVECIDAGAPGA